MLINQFLLLSAVLFGIGVYGVIVRRNGVLVFVIAVAAAEVGVGLAIVLLIYRNRTDVNLDELSEMKG